MVVIFKPMWTYYPFKVLNVQKGKKKSSIREPHRVPFIFIRKPFHAISEDIFVNLSHYIILNISTFLLTWKYLVVFVFERSNTKHIAIL